MSYFEKDAIVSGLGISRIGRKTGIPGLELTMEAVRAAITDAGLAPDDIDGIATFGDTLPSEVVEALGNHATDVGVGFGTGGVLTPFMSASSPWQKGGHAMCWSIGRCRCSAGR